MAGYVLSETDRNTLVEMIAWWRAQTEEITKRLDEEPQQAPDTYVAVAPSGGIPALAQDGVVTGTGSQVAGPPYTLLPGYADCDLYAVNEQVTPPALVQIPGLKRTVYNLTGSAISSGGILATTRDKLGRWLAVGGGGNGIRKGTLSGTLNYGSSVTVRLWMRVTATGLEVDTGVDVLAYDWLLKSGQSMAAGTQVALGFDDLSGVFYVIGGQCGT